MNDENNTNPEPAGFWDEMAQMGFKPIPHAHQATTRKTAG